MGQIKNIKLHIVTDISHTSRGEKQAYTHREYSSVNSLTMRDKWKKKRVRRLKRKKKDESKPFSNEIVWKMKLSTITCGGSVDVDLNVENKVIDIQMQCCLYTCYFDSKSII